jgi:hypothetical protein
MNLGGAGSALAARTKNPVACLAVDWHVEIGGDDAVAVGNRLSYGRGPDQPERSGDQHSLGHGPPCPQKSVFRNASTRNMFTIRAVMSGLYGIGCADCHDNQ